MMRRRMRFAMGWRLIIQVAVLRVPGWTADADKTCAEQRQQLQPCKSNATSRTPVTDALHDTWTAPPDGEATRRRVASAC